MKNTTGSVVRPGLTLAPDVPSPSFARATRGFVALGAFLCLTIPCTSAFSQWQSFDRPGADFRALAVSDSTIFAFGIPGALHKSTNNGSTWTVVKWRMPMDYTGFCLGILDGMPVGGTSKGSFLSRNMWSWYRQAVDGIEDDIQAAGSTKRDTLSTWYLGGFGGGVRRSTDQGLTWALCNEGLTDLNVTSFATIAAPGDTSQVLFAGTYGGGVFRSEDDGTHWGLSSSGLDNVHVYALAAHGDTLYAAHSGGRVSRSPDAGTNWMQLGTGLPPTDIISLASVTLIGVRSLYAGTIDAGIWRYDPGRTLWEPLNTGLKSLRINAIVAKDSLLFVATERGIFRSLDFGSRWELTSGAATPLVSSVFAASFPSGGPATRLFTVSDAHYYLKDSYSRGIGGGDLCSAVSWTDDLGRSWTTAPFSPNFISTTSRFEYFSVQHNDCIFLFNTGAGEYDYLQHLISTDKGATWDARVDDYGFKYSVLRGVILHGVPSEHRFELYIGLTGGPNPGVWRSLDSGKTMSTWSQVIVPSIGVIRPPLVSHDSGFYAVYATGALWTPDGGQTWTRITYNGVYPYYVPQGSSTSVPMFRLLHANSDRLFARVAPSTAPGEPGGLYASTDHGATWTPAGFTGQIVDRIVEADSILFTVFSGHAFASRTSTILWKDITESLSSDSIVVITASPEYVVALTQASDRIWCRPMSEIKALLSEKPPQPLLSAPADGTASDSTRMTFRWTPVSYASAYGLQLSEDPAFSTAMRVDSSGIADTLFTVASLAQGKTYHWRVRASNGNGFSPWSPARHFTISPTATGVTAEGLPTEFALLQNYPNPFNPSTTIRYQVPVACNVKLVVFDLLGRELAVLVDESKEAGRYEARFDASGVSSGVYFYRMQAGDFIATRTLILLR